ncbi:MAG: SMP-30/gluconolactonase/LRE family protein [Methylophilaceae bacterium]
MLFNQSTSRSFKTILLSAVISASLIACSDKEVTETESATPAAVELTKITGLKSPESVVQATDGKIYVSEINEFGKDGDGQISVIENGHLSVFSDGFDDPKGLVIIGDWLYVADKTHICRVNLADASQVEAFVPASAFPKTPQFLNDLEADPQGNLYVSDSGDILGTGKGGVIYKINASGEVTKLVDGADNPLVMAPNGLLADDTGKSLLFVDFTSGVLYNLNTETGEVLDLDEGFGGGDGLVHHSSGVMYVSDWKNGKVFAIGLDGEITTVGPQYQAAADIALTKDERYLMVPDMKAGELDFIDLTAN